MKKKRREIPFEEREFFFQTNFKSIEKTKDYGLSATDEEGVLVEGYANTSELDRGNDIVEPRAFEQSINKNYKNNPIILFQHDHYRGIGRAIELRITERGLYVKALIFDEEIKKKIQHGIYRTFSIGFSVNSEKYYSKDGVLLNPDNSADLQRIFYEEGVKRVISDLELYEISVVSVPMNADSLFDLSKSVKKYFQEKINHLKNENMHKLKIVNELKSDEPKEAVEAVEEVEQRKEQNTETQEETPVSEVVEETAEVVSDETSADNKGDETSAEAVETTKEEAEVSVETETEKSAFGVEKSMLTVENFDLALKTVAELKAVNLELQGNLEKALDVLAQIPVNKGYLNIESKQFDAQVEEKQPSEVKEKASFKSFLRGMAEKN